MNTLAPAPPAQTALEHAQSFVQFLITVASAVIGFSVTLIDRAALLSSFTLLLIWIFMSASVLGGILGYSRTVIMLSEANFDLHDRFFEWPVRLQQVAFALGILAVGWSLVLVAHNPSKTSEPNEVGANQAKALLELSSSINALSHSIQNASLPSAASQELNARLDQLNRNQQQILTLQQRAARELSTAQSVQSKLAERIADVSLNTSVRHGEFSQRLQFLAEDVRHLNGLSIQGNDHSQPTITPAVPSVTCRTRIVGFGYANSTCDSK